jgi:glycosyltransferase involved in cell wall biosynthesis
LIYPPVDLGAFSYCVDKEDFYLTASRMVPYKKIDLIVEAFSLMPDKKLVVIGDGPDFEKIRSKAGKNITLMGYQSFDVLKDFMQRARAFVFAAEEDFGIAPLEAQACGTPVIAYGKGGALETIRGLEHPEPSGIFFANQTVSSLIESVLVFELERENITPEACRENVMRFSIERFQLELQEYITSQLDIFNNKQNDKTIRSVI